MNDMPGRLVGHHILVVEDESILGLYFSDLLKAEGCTVVGPISTVHQALEALSRERFDAAVLDLNLRGERSVAIARHMAEQSTPFVIVSGYSGDTLRDPTIQSVPFLEKPFTATTLIDALATAVQQHGTLSTAD